MLSEHNIVTTVPDPALQHSVEFEPDVSHFPYISQASAVAELSPGLYFLQHVGHHDDHEFGMSP